MYYITFFILIIILIFIIVAIINLTKLSLHNIEKSLSVSGGNIKKQNIAYKNDEKNDNIIIHISGPSGSGKSTLGNIIKNQFGDKIVVKDIDDLRADFVLKFYGGYDKFWKNKYKWNSKEYQKYIDDFVIKHQNKPIIFVGLNHMPWWNKKLYYNMHAIYKYYIQLKSDIIFNQKCSRAFDEIFVNDREKTLSNIRKYDKKYLKRMNNYINSECNYKQIKTMNKIWNLDYSKQKYKFMSSDDIFKEITNILNIK